MPMFRKPKRVTVTIPANQTVSPEIYIHDYVIGGLILPATLAVAISMSFQVAAANLANSGVYVPLYDAEGNLVQALIIAASHGVGLDGAKADAFSAFQWARLVLNQAENVDTVIDVLLK